MIWDKYVEEDEKIKAWLRDRATGSVFDWARGIPDGGRSIEVETASGTQRMTAADLANIIGQSLSTLLMIRGESGGIDSSANRSIVHEVTQEVLETFDKQPDRWHHRDVRHVLTYVLANRDQHDLARSLLSHAPWRRTAAPSAMPAVIRRNGKRVKWHTEKIEIAIRKAFLALQRDSSPAVAIAEQVESICAGQEPSIGIEIIQDTVIQTLRANGYGDVAEAYSDYRDKRAAWRLNQAISESAGDLQVQLVNVSRTDGASWLWDGTDLRCRIEFALRGLELEDGPVAIERELRRSIFDDISEADLSKTIMLNAKALIERDADYALFAGRIMLSYLYEEVLDWEIMRDGFEGITAAHRRFFRQGLEQGVELGRLNGALLDYDLDRLADALDPAADLAFDYLGIQTLYDRYLLVDKRGPARRIETPQLFWMRVAMGLFLGESGDREARVIELYRLYASRRFCSSTPTLFNSGTPRSQLSSCYLYKVDDSIESIMQRGIAENAFLSKWAGGLGGSWTAVRGTGSYIQGTNGESQGVIPFLKLHNDQLIAVNQGGKRRGSGCAYLEVWHSDILDFLELRRNTGDERRRTHDMNTACWIPDLFMKRMEAREDWTLFRSSEVPELHECYGRTFEEKYCSYESQAAEGKIFGKVMPAIELWKQMLKMLFETGHPWITFKDPCNVRSPQDHAGVIHSSNLCTEITLNTGPEETAVCNLGSVVLDQHLRPDGQLDHEKLRATIRTAIRALDNVIDINFYPTEAARKSNLRHRPIGLGVMGLANALQQKGISFASDEAIAFNDEFMEAIAFYAYEASSDLAAERGVYSSYKGSKWDRGLLPQDTVALLGEERGQIIDVPEGGRLDWQPLREKISRQGMRNSNVLAIAPTATISNIMGTSPCIEPLYKNLLVKSNLSGDFVVLNRGLVNALKQRGLWDKEMREDLKYYDGELAEIDRIPEAIRHQYITAFNIDYLYLIKAAARRQKWIDQSQSLNLFLPVADLKTMSHMYRAAWHHGLKTTYYLRTLGASRIEKATVDVRHQSSGESDDQGSVAACRLDAMMNGGECEACQ